MTKSLKRITLLLLITILIFSNSVFAKSTFSAGEVEFKNSLIYISGKTPSPQMSVMVSVTKAADSKSNIENLYYIEEILSDENSNYEFSFNMKDAPQGSTLTGDYKLYIKCEDENIITKNFTYYDYSAVLNQLNKAENGDKVFEILENKAERNSLVALGFNMDMYDLLSETQRKELSKMFFDLNLTQSDAKDISQKFSSAIIVSLANSKNKDYVEKALLLLNPLRDKEEYKKITDTDYKSFVGECIVLMEDLALVDDVESAFKKADALYKINASSVGMIDLNIKNNANILEIEESNEYKKWSGLDEERLTASSKKLVGLLSNKKAKTISILLSSIDSALKTDSSSNVGGSSSGGGGSKSSGGGYTLSGVTTILPETEKFNDLNLSLWAKDAIISLSDKNILSGYEDGSFKPTNLIKREEFVKVIVSAFNVVGEDKEIEFFDVEKDKWYYPYIKSAFNSGIIKGISDTDFGISGYITRQDMAVMLHRILDLNNINIPDKRSYQTFKDEEGIKDYALDSVKVLFEKGLINGYEDLTFKPSGNATRAEIAYIIDSILSAE